MASSHWRKPHTPAVSQRSTAGDLFGSADGLLSCVSGILSMIIIRTLRKDIANYNKEDDIVRGLGEGGVGWERKGVAAVVLCACYHL